MRKILFVFLYLFWLDYIIEIIYASNDADVLGCTVCPSRSTTLQNRSRELDYPFTNTTLDQERSQQHEQRYDPIFGIVRNLDLEQAFELIRQQTQRRISSTSTASPSNKNRTFFDYAFIPPPASSPRSTSDTALNDTLFTFILYYCTRCPFSHSMYRNLNALAFAFPSVQFLAININAPATRTSSSSSSPYSSTRTIKALYNNQNKYINQTITFSIPLITNKHKDIEEEQDPAEGGASSSTPLSSASPWVASISFFTRALIRACPSLLLLHGNIGVDSNSTWGRSYTQLSQQLSALTNITALPLNHTDMEVWRRGEEDGSTEDPETLLDTGSISSSFFPLLSVRVLSSLDGYSDVGLLLSVIGMTIIHLLQRCRERIENIELEALAQQHVAM